MPEPPPPPPPESLTGVYVATRHDLDTDGRGVGTQLAGGADRRLAAHRADSTAHAARRPNHGDSSSRAAGDRDREDVGRGSKKTTKPQPAQQQRPPEDAQGGPRHPQASKQRQAKPPANRHHSHMRNSRTPAQQPHVGKEGVTLWHGGHSSRRARAHPIYNKHEGQGDQRRGNKWQKAAIDQGRVPQAGAAKTRGVHTEPGSTDGGHLPRRRRGKQKRRPNAATVRTGPVSRCSSIYTTSPGSRKEEEPAQAPNPHNRAIGQPTTGRTSSHHSQRQRSKHSKEQQTPRPTARPHEHSQQGNKRRQQQRVRAAAAASQHCRAAPTAAAVAGETG